MKQQQPQNVLFRYGVRQISPHSKPMIHVAPHSSTVLDGIDHMSTLNENVLLKSTIDEKQMYINKLLGIIGKQRKELSDKQHLIKCLEVDLKKYKKLSQELQDVVKQLSEKNDFMRRQQRESPSTQIKQTPTQKQRKDVVNVPQIELLSSSESQVPFFEKFLMISVQKEAVYDVVRDSNEKFFMQQSLTQDRVKPEVLFQYPEIDKKWQKDYKSILPQMIFPYGIETKLCKKSDSLSELNEYHFQITQRLIYNGLSPDKFENVSVLTFKSDEAFQGETNGWLLSVNPNNLLYCICLEQRDFFNEEQNPNRQKRKFISALKTYMFMTKLPLISFFVDILHIIINDLKLRKASLHATMDHQVNIDAIDLEFHRKYEQEFTSVLSSLIQIRIMENIQTKVFSETLFYELPSLSEYMDCEWGAYMILSIITLPQFIRILSALLCEQQIVIISQKRNVISAAMLLFHSLLKPFKWVHPFISTISQEMMQLFDSPVPIFIGVLRDERFIVLEELYDNYDQILFLEFEGSLKEGQMSMTIVQQNSTDLSASPSLVRLENTLQPLFSRLKMKDNINNHIEHKDIIPTPDEFEIRTYREIFEQVKLFYECEIISYIPSQNEVVEDDKIDYHKVMKTVESRINTTDEFICQFLRTQSFTYYLEEIFQL